MNRRKIRLRHRGVCVVAADVVYPSAEIKNETQEIRGAESVGETKNVGRAGKSKRVDIAGRTGKNENAGKPGKNDNGEKNLRVEKAGRAEKVKTAVKTENGCKRSEKRTGEPTVAEGIDVFNGFYRALAEKYCKYAENEVFAAAVGRYDACTDKNKVYAFRPVICRFGCVCERAGGIVAVTLRVTGETDFSARQFWREEDMIMLFDGEKMYLSAINVK